MPANRKTHAILDAIFDSGDAEFIQATELILRTQLRGAVARQHANRFPTSSEEAVRYFVLSQRGRQPRKNNGS